jgi:hypothetical protein
LGPIPNVSHEVYTNTTKFKRKMEFKILILNVSRKGYSMLEPTPAFFETAVHGTTNRKNPLGKPSAGQAKTSYQHFHLCSPSSMFDFNFLIGGLNILPCEQF